MPRQVLGDAFALDVANADIELASAAACMAALLSHFAGLLFGCSQSFACQVTKRKIALGFRKPAVAALRYHFTASAISF